MSSLLLAESGSTKTDWCLLRKKGKPIYFKTTGINPHLQSAASIASLLEEELGWNPEKHRADNIVFYGAGASKQDKQQELTSVLHHFFGSEHIEVHGDILAAARALCGQSQGVVCILGTGSNAAYYDGNCIRDQHASLGFLAGDEGSGNYMGKRILQYYAYNTFDDELRSSFEMMFGTDLQAIVSKLYSTQFPNRLLAKFVELLITHRGHFMVENIIEDCLNDFFHYHVLKYRQSWNMPLYFTGSVAYEFRDVIVGLCAQYELELGAIVKSPLSGLISFHQQFL